MLWVPAMDVILGTHRRSVAAPLLQLRVPEETLVRIDEIRGDATRSAWLQRLIDRELNGQPATQALTGGIAT